MRERKRSSSIGKIVIVRDEGSGIEALASRARSQHRSVLAV